MTNRMAKIPDENIRTFVSLALFIHLFCIAVVLSSNVAPSTLQQDLVEIVAPYTKTTHLDPNFLPFQMTTGDEGSRLHQWQVISDGRIIERFPSTHPRGGFNRQRHDMFARVGGYYALNEDPNLPAEMARSLAESVIAASSRKLDRLLVRCVRYVDGSDPTVAVPDADGVVVLYEADVWLTQAGELNVLKRTEPRRSAPSIVPNPN